MYTGMTSPLTITGLDKVSGAKNYSTYKYEYDYLNRLVKTTDALGQVQTYTPNYSGLVEHSTDRNGNNITNEYDYFGNALKTQVVSPDGKIDMHTFEYNMLGAMTKADNVSYEYDNLGNMVKETDGNTVKEYQYDSFGNRTEFKLTVNETEKIHLQYSYNSVNLLDKITDLLDNKSIVEEYQYNDNGVITSKYTPGNNVTVSYESNNAGQITKITVTKGEEVIGLYEYSYYANGNQKEKKEVVNNGELSTTEYEYDGLGRLITESNAEQSISYIYDGHGNRETMTVTGEDAYTVNYSYDLNNRLRNEIKTYGETEEETKYGYDNNGNMISKMSSNNGYSVIPSVSLSTSGKGWGLYEYNGFNQLVTAEEDGVKSSYTYDHNGLRQSKTVNGTTTSHIWDGTNMVMDITGTAETLYIRGMGIVSSNSGEEKRYYLYNGHGDVNMLMDASGNITKQYIYDAFGVEQNKDKNDTNPFRYCGEYYDAETDSIYLRARYYSPTTGRFISEDPIQDGLNWYVYCGSNPIACIDPSGLITISGESDVIMTAEGITPTGWENMGFNVWEEECPSDNFYSTYLISPNMTMNIIEGFPYVNQGEHPWCWAAVASEIDAFAGGEYKSMEQIVIDKYKRLVDRGGGGLKTLAELFRNQELLKGSDYALHTILYNGENVFNTVQDEIFRSLTAGALMKAIDKYSLLVMYKSESSQNMNNKIGDAHFSVAIGYVSNNNTGEMKVLFRDSRYYLETYKYNEIKNCKFLEFYKR